MIEVPPAASKSIACNIHDHENHLPAEIIIRDAEKNKSPTLPAFSPYFVVGATVT
ncbi:MAG: hypothetical protein OEM02_05285 [Desulfobulbaceae bacterium]|nr:hypothetical protein [Desulfobulbaceae bacterium]